MLSFGNINVDVLCSTEHWLREDQLSSVYIDQFRFVGSLVDPPKIADGRVSL